MKRWPAFDTVPREADGALVVVGHSECPTTRLMLGALDRLHRRRTRKVAVSALLQDEPGDARALAAELGLALPLVLDGDPYPVTSSLDLEGVPTTFLLGPDGAVRERLEAFSRAEVERLGALLGVEGPVFAPEEKVPAHRPG
jgi:hypothetical protein